MTHTPVTVYSQQTVASPAYARVMPHARSAAPSIPYFIAAVIFGVAWLMGGSQTLNDVGWIILVGATIVFLLRELYRTPEYLGLGRLFFFGGVLLWFAFSYFKYWFIAPPADYRIFDDATAGNILTGMSKASFFAALFFGFVVIGMTIPWGRRIVNLIGKVPEPANPNVLLGVIIVMFGIGIMPYFLFTAEPFYQAIWKSFWAMRSGEGARWTVGRTGNLNFSWGAYVAQWMQIGQFGSILAGFYAIFYARDIFVKALCWAMWAFALGIAFGTGDRGKVVYVVLPIVALFFVKHQLHVHMLLHWFKVNRLKGYGTVLAILALAFTLVQIQAWQRNRGALDGIHITTERVLDVKGNDMLGESLFVFINVPDNIPFVYDQFPGHGAIMALPVTAYYFAVGPIPRALWHNKPVDSAWVAINQARGHHGTRGTTISHGLTGHWYIRFGALGLIVGALFWGWLYATFERAFIYFRDRPMSILVCLMLMTWLFRCFRSVNFNTLYPIMIALTVYWLIMTFVAKRPSHTITSHT